MRKLLVLSLVVMFVFGIVFVAGCKKEAATDKPADTEVKDGEGEAAPAEGEGEAAPAEGEAAPAEGAAE